MLNFRNNSQQFDTQITTSMLQNPLAGLLPPDQADLILVMIVSIPLSYLLCIINNKYLMLTLSMALTLSFQSLLFPSEKWFLWGQQQVVYLLVIFSPRKFVGHVVLVESFIALTVVQLRRMSMTYGENGVDITGIFMMQLFNYIGLGYNYQNGAKPEESLTIDQLQRRVVNKPKYLTYLGYVNFLPACLVGPVYEYADYDSYLHRRDDYVNIPNPLPAVFREGGVFALGIVLYFALSHFHIDRVVWPEFEEYNFFYKLFYMMVCITFIELKYVAAWSLGMMSMRASGITYNPSKNVVNKDNSIIYNFSRVEVTNMKGFYFAPAFKVKGDSWNMSVQVALKRYIYENIYNPKDFTDDKKRKKRQVQAQLSTVLVSALWHGLYPGYFISFVHWLFFMQIGIEIFRERQIKGSRVNKFYQKHETLCNNVENFFSTFAMTYFGMPFHLMTFARFWIYIKTTYFLPYILLYIANYLFVQRRILSDKPKKGEIKNQEKKD